MVSVRQTACKITWTSKLATDLGVHQAGLSRAQLGSRQHRSTPPKASPRAALPRRWTLSARRPAWRGRDVGGNGMSRRPVGRQVGRAAIRHSPPRHRHARRLAHAGIGPPAAAGERGAVHQLTAAAPMEALAPRSHYRRPPRRGRDGRLKRQDGFGLAASSGAGQRSRKPAPPRGRTLPARGRKAAAHRVRRAVRRAGGRQRRRAASGEAGAAGRDFLRPLLRG